MPVETAEPSADYPSLLRLERERLLDLLASVEDVDWARPTPCPAWDVAGLCRHLLGDDLYVLSLARDGHQDTTPPPGLDEAGFIAWLDRLQMDWVAAARRVSPRLVVELLSWLGPHVAEAFEQMDLLAVDADVSWASDHPVPQWLEAAREVSEYWIHRQQLLTALGYPTDLRADLLGPILDAFRWAYAYRLASVDAAPGATVRIDVRGAVERRWRIVRGDRWDFAEDSAGDVVAVVRLDADQAWRLLTNNLDRHAVLDITGDPAVVDVLRRTRAIIGAPE